VAPEKDAPRDGGRSEPVTHRVERGIDRRSVPAVERQRELDRSVVVEVGEADADQGDALIADHRQGRHEQRSNLSTSSRKPPCFAEIFAQTLRAVAVQLSSGVPTTDPVLGRPYRPTPDSAELAASAQKFISYLNKKSPKNLASGKEI